jgi:hypothetical protein
VVTRARVRRAHDDDDADAIAIEHRARARTNLDVARNADAPRLRARVASDAADDDAADDDDDDDDHAIARARAAGRRTVARQPLHASLGRCGGRAPKSATWQPPPRGTPTHHR